MAPSTSKEGVPYPSPSSLTKKKAKKKAVALLLAEDWKSPPEMIGAEITQEAGSILHLVPPLLPWDASQDNCLSVCWCTTCQLSLLTRWREICILWVQTIPMDPFDLLAGSLFVNLLVMKSTKTIFNWTLICGLIYTMESIQTTSWRIIPLRWWRLTMFFSFQSSTLLQEITFVPKQSITKLWFCLGGEAAFHA